MSIPELIKYIRHLKGMIRTLQETIRRMNKNQTATDQ